MCTPIFREADEGRRIHSMCDSSREGCKKLRSKCAGRYRTTLMDTRERPLQCRSSDCGCVAQAKSNVENPIVIAVTPYSSIKIQLALLHSQRHDEQHTYGMVGCSPRSSSCTLPNGLARWVILHTQPPRTNPTKSLAFRA
jgi:hypothetical protein